MSTKHTQGIPFDGEFYWINDKGVYADHGNEIEGYLEQRYEVSGTIETYLNGQYWTRHKEEF